jgi:hypothetical protein
MSRLLPPVKLASVDHLIALASDGIDGYNWYSEAAAQINFVCRIEGWDSDDFAGVLATSSPRVSVIRNIRLALHVLHFEDLRVIPMRGIRSSVKRWRDHGEIVGPKTNAFYHNLSGRLDHVTLDVWMAHALCVDQKDFNRKATHRTACELITRVGTIIGIKPAEAQAAIWMGQRSRDGRNHSPFSVLSEYLAARRNHWDIVGCSISNH